MLAALNFLVLALSGEPLILTSAFSLWGGKTASALGLNVASWPSWASHSQAAALAAPLSHDVNSVIDVGIILGGMLAAALAGRFAPIWRVPARSLVAPIVSGFLLGYGAKLAYGCTIAAYFSGIVSGSAHAWPGCDSWRHSSETCLARVFDRYSGWKWSGLGRRHVRSLVLSVFSDRKRVRAGSRRPNC